MRYLATTALQALMAASLVTCDGGGTVAPEATSAPTTTRAPVASSPTAGATRSPSVATPPARAPDRAIAIEGGRLVEMEVPAGRPVDGLDAALGPTGLGEGASSLTLSHARHTVLFSRTISAASQEIVEVPLDDGQAEVVANGHTIATTPDGERFAVGRRELDGQDAGLEVLEVRTFDGQAAGRWADPVASEEPISISQLSWSPDGQQVAFELRFEDGTETRVLDVTAEDGSLQAVSQQVEPLGDLRMLSAPEFRPDDGVLVAVDGPGLDPDARQQWRVVALDPTGDVEDVLVETDRAVTELDFDHTGQHLLYVLGHAHAPHDQGPVAPPELMYWHDGSSTHVRGEIADVAW